MRYFTIRELISPEIFNILSYDSCWNLIPPCVQESLDAIRHDLGLPIRINNWHKGGGFKYSGIRPKDCTIGAKLSAHKVKHDRLAFDLKCDKMEDLFRLLQERIGPVGSDLRYER